VLDEKSSTNESESNYRGLRMHAAPHLHDECIATLKRIGLPPHAKVLDLGAGEGAFSQRLLDEGFDVTAADARPDYFRANTECRRVDLNTDFDEQWCDKFDSVVAIEIVEHLANPRHFIRNCLRALKSTGYLLLTSPNPENWLSRIRFLREGRFLWFRDADYRYYGHITPIFSWQIAQICEELSAELVSVHHTHNGPLLRWLGDGWLGVLTNKTFMLGALYPFMKGRRDGEVNIYLIRRRA